MAVSRITPEQIELMNEIYATTKNYSEVSRQVGVSPATVKKYIYKDYIPKSKVVKISLSDDLIKTVETYIMSADILKDPLALVLSEEEKALLNEFRKEMTI